VRRIAARRKASRGERRGGEKRRGEKESSREEHKDLNLNFGQGKMDPETDAKKEEPAQGKVTAGSAEEMPPADGGDRVDAGGGRSRKGGRGGEGGRGGRRGG